MIAVAIALLVTGNWVLSELVSFTQSLFDQLPRAARPDLRPPWTSRSRRSTLAALLLGTARATGFVLLAPPFNSKTIPGAGQGARSPWRCRCSLSTQIAADAAGAHGRATCVVTAVTEVVIGAALGFVVQVLFTAVQMAGDLIDVTGGFSLQPAYDPLAMTQNATIGRLHYLLAITLLFTSGGAPADRQGLRDLLRGPARRRRRADRPAGARC